MAQRDSPDELNMFNCRCLWVSALHSSPCTLLSIPVSNQRFSFPSQCKKSAVIVTWRAGFFMCDCSDGEAIDLFAWNYLAFFPLPFFSRSHQGKVFFLSPLKSIVDKFIEWISNVFKTEMPPLKSPPFSLSLYRCLSLSLLLFLSVCHLFLSSFQPTLPLSLFLSLSLSSIAPLLSASLFHSLSIFLSPSLSLSLSLPETLSFSLSLSFFCHCSSTLLLWLIWHIYSKMLNNSLCPRDMSTLSNVSSTIIITEILLLHFMD